jgi:hypothetical protein
MFFFNLEIPAGRLALLSPQVRDASASGIHLYSTTFDSWPWEGSPPDYTGADQQMDLFLKADPKAIFLLRVNISPPYNWVGWRDRDRLRDTEDYRYADGSTEPVSAASDFYFQASLIDGMLCPAQCTRFGEAEHVPWVFGNTCLLNCKPLQAKGLCLRCRRRYGGGGFSERGRQSLAAIRCCQQNRGRSSNSKSWLPKNHGFQQPLHVVRC